MEPALETWLQPQEWQRDSDTPTVSLGEPGAFDDMHLFAPCVFFENGQYWMYYAGSRKAVDAGDYKGALPATKDSEAPRRIDQRLFQIGLAQSTDGVHFTKFEGAPVLSFGDNVHSIVTPNVLRNPDGSLLRENGRLRMWFSAVDFPGGTYKHDIHESTSEDGIHWSPPSSVVLENAYAPHVIREDNRYRMWFIDVGRRPWVLRHAESEDGTHWSVDEEPCLVPQEQAWEGGDHLVYPSVIKVDDVYVMLYGSLWEGPTRTAIGLAVSNDGISWTKFAGNPVFRPEPSHDWESHFTTSQTLLRLSDGSYRIWYASRKQPPWSNLYFAIGTAHWAGPAR